VFDVKNNNINHIHFIRFIVGGFLVEIFQALSKLCKVSRRLLQWKKRVCRTIITTYRQSNISNVG
jgi:hypothetical protein